jgi:hypothetical protein
VAILLTQSVQLGFRFAGRTELGYTLLDPAAEATIVQARRLVAVAESPAQPGYYTGSIECPAGRAVTIAWDDPETGATARDTVQVGGITAPVGSGGAGGSTLREALYSYLAGSPEVAALVGRRIYPDYLPQGARVPALVYAVLADDPVRHLDGKTGIAEARVQVECRAATRGGCVELAGLVEGLLDRPSYALGTVQVRWCHREAEQDVTEPIDDGSGSNRYLYPVTYLVNYRA